MKKVLLLSLSVCAVLSASAIDRTVKVAQKANVSLHQSFSPLKSYATVAKESLNISSKVQAKLPAANDIYGLYVSESTDEGDGTIAFSISSNIEFIQINETDPETGDIYNVEVKGLFGDADVIGCYDAEAGTITIPAQYCNEHPEYGLLAFYGVTSYDETQGYGLADEFVLQVQEDENGFYFEPAEGYIGYCDIFTEGQYEGYIMDVCYNDVIINPANFVVTGESRNSLSSAESEWEDLEDYGVFLEMIDEETMFIHGFMGHGTVEVKFDENGLATIPTYQPVRYGNIGNGYAYIGAPVAWDINGQSISINNDREFVYGGWYTFTYNNTGEQVEGFALYDGREEGSQNWEYYSLGVEGMKGGFGPLCVLTLIVKNNNAAGIHELSNPVLKKPATYSLSGKRVSKNAKGIVIEDGKKVIR